ncbi:MAG: right-handed parallel beta-helix repeat-containing protein [Deltaproteobacteria bacterium]|nr:right-handed parallel beta-helix repeat-containing protein [Deltaproteobacteria bacterium]
MGRLLGLWLALASGLAAGCGGDEETSPGGGGGSGGSGGSGGQGGPHDCSAGQIPLSDGTCHVPAIQQNGCPAGEVLLDEACVPAGIPPDMCGDGFEPDGEQGCVPILPDDDCAPGTMAVPGDTECHPVAPCGAAPWGDIPVESDTEHVDASYSGGSSDGSSAAPWTTIQAGVDAAADGAIVAIAAGTYAETVTIGGKSVRLWGRCPTEVIIAGAGHGVQVNAGASASEVRDVQITGGTTAAVRVEQAAGVLLDRLWIHENGGIGLWVTGGGDTGATLSRSLVEQTTAVGVHVESANVELDGCVVRDVEPQGGGDHGRGVNVQMTGSSLTIRGSLIERTHEAGVFVGAASLLVDGSVVRDTAPSDVDQERGHGIELTVNPATGAGSTAEIHRSVLANNHTYGITASGSTVTISTTVVRDTEPSQASGAAGVGVRVGRHLEGVEPPALTMNHVVVRGSNSAGVIGAGGLVDIFGSVIRDTEPRQSDGLAGRGINVEVGEGLEPAVLTLTASVVEGSHEGGVVGIGSSLDLEGVWIRDTAEVEVRGCTAYGVIAQDDAVAQLAGALTLAASVVEASHEGAILVLGTSAEIRDVWVRQVGPVTAYPDAGDGLMVISYDGQGAPAPVFASATVDRLLIEEVNRAGMTTFGAELSLSASRIDCAPIALNTEVWATFDPAIQDGGNNTCGCGQVSEPCQAHSTGLVPPDPLK